MLAFLFPGLRNIKNFLLMRIVLYIKWPTRTSGTSLLGHHASEMSMFKPSPIPRGALTAARSWARAILDRHRDLINDRPNRAAAAEAPPGCSPARCATTSTTPRTTHAALITTAKLHSALALPCTFVYDLAPALGNFKKKWFV